MAARKSRSGNPSRRKATARRPQNEVENKVLVVTEGTVTEPQYFERLKGIISEDFGVQLVVRPKLSKKPKTKWTSNPVSVVEQAIRIRDEANDQGGDVVPYACCFAVVDVDQWNQGKQPTALRQAIALAQKEGIVLVVSNLKFEVWLLCHADESSRPPTTSAELDKRCASAGLMRGKTLKTDFPFGRYGEAKAVALQLGRVKAGQAGPNPSTAMPNFLDAIRALAD
ncbi:RloB family protein [Corynebacterium sp. HMSC29G08]|uniref:RloB family protein n=1 Tax=Corynebacterium sp. HMSC29G08 TaxID=1581069 RepID=UPI0008A530E3|nr:RloB family protein [Corynebacterium sp. HMSC29G08]